MESGHFEDVFPCISYKKCGYPIAMLVYQRVEPLVRGDGCSYQILSCHYSHLDAD